MPASLTASAAEGLRSVIDDACRRNTDKIPGATISIVNRTGEPIFTHAAGTIPRNEKPDEQRAIRLDDSLRMFSCGKLLATIVALQLVDEGRLDLDSPDLLEAHLPELKAKDKVFARWVSDQNGDSRPEWKPRQRRVTVRMLLNHSTQLSNGFIDKDFEAMNKWYHSTHEKVEGDGNYQGFREAFDMYYFLDEPGNFRYTGGVEWAGLLLERLTGESLASLYKRRILEPLGMKDTEVIHWCEAVPDASRLFTNHMRLPDGTLVPIPIPQGTNYAGDQPHADFKAFPDSDKHAYAVSMCVLSNPPDYSRILAAILNGGVSPTTKARILTKASLDAMIEPQLSPEQFQIRLATDRTSLSIPLDLSRLDPEGNVGLACGVQGADRQWPDGKKGRSRGSAYWYGLANSDWWVDFENGIAVFSTTQLFPWNDPSWLELMEQVEKIIYEGLETGS